MNDNELIWESYCRLFNEDFSNIKEPLIKMIDPKKVLFTEKDQERGRINQIKNNYGNDFSLIDWDEQPKPIISVDEEGTLRVEDGHHRVAAFIELDYPKFNAILVPKETFDIMKERHGLQNAAKIIANDLGDMYTYGQTSYQ